jgi:hypothetical protein
VSVASERQDCVWRVIVAGRRFASSATLLRSLDEYPPKVRNKDSTYMFIYRRENFKPLATYFGIWDNPRAYVPTYLTVHTYLYPTLPYLSTLPQPFVCRSYVR